MTEQINRRSLVKGAAWAAPAVVATTAMPAYAASCGSTPTIFARAFYHYNSAWDNGGYVQNGSYTYKFYSFNSALPDNSYGTIDTCINGLCTNSTVTNFQVTLWIVFSDFTFKYGPGNYTSWSPLVRDSNKSTAVFKGVTYYPYTTTYLGELPTNGTSVCLPDPFTFESNRTGKRRTPLSAFYEWTANVDGKLVRESTGVMEYTRKENIIRS